MSKGSLLSAINSSATANTSSSQSYHFSSNHLELHGRSCESPSNGHLTSLTKPESQIHACSYAYPLSFFVLHDICNGLFRNRGLLLIVPVNTIIVITEVGTLHEFQELLIMRDDDQLKIRLVPSALDDIVK